MVEISIRKFANEKLSDDYIPVIHGQTRSLKPLVLLVKQKRDLWKLPFAATELRTLAGLGEYVTDEKKKEFEDITSSTFKSEKVEIEREEEDITFSSFDTESEDTNNSDQVDIKLEDDFGVLHLGHLYEEYHLDEDLPDILSKAVLNANGIKTLEENVNCLLVSSVVYSERFELGSSSYGENESMATDQQEKHSEFVSLLGKHAEAAGDFTMDTTVSGPSVPTRKTPGPFLFSVREVYYDKGTRLLKIRGTESEATSGHRDFETHHDNYHKYEELVVDSGGKQKDVTPCTTEDKKRMENIKKFLMTVDTTEKRKHIVRQYLDWFKTILTSEQKKMTLETPLTDGDCEFLRVLFIPAVTGQKELNWQNLSDRREIHRYGVLFKRLFDLTDKAWDELQNILDAGR